MTVRVRRVLIRKMFHLGNQRTIRVKRYLKRNFIKNIKNITFLKKVKKYQNFKKIKHIPNFQN